MKYVISIETNFGVINAELDGDRAPITANNFIHYVNEGFFNNLIFHRVIPNFMIQGGGFTPQMQEKPTDMPPIINEARKSGLKNLRGTLAMARTSDPNSATSQFFINLVDNPFLDPNPDNPHGYAVFGRVIRGMEVVDRIATVPTRTVGPYENVPTNPVIIKRIYLVQ